MTDLERFEPRLQARLLAHVEGSVREFDPLRVAGAAAAGAGAQGWPGRLLDRLAMRPGGRAVPAAIALFLLGLLALAAIGASIVGSQLLQLSPWSVLERRVVGGLSAARCGAEAVALDDGGALVVGGWSEAVPTLAAAERFDPGTGTFGPVSGDVTPGRRSTLTPLADGRVLIAGGVRALWHKADCTDRVGGGRADAYIFDPASDRIEPTGAMVTARYGHAAIRLDDGRVLIAGGTGELPDGGWGPTASAEVFDPATGTFQPTGPMLHPQLRLTRLPDGRVLATGDIVDGTWQRTHAQVPADAQIYDPATGMFELSAPDPTANRTDKVAVHGSRCGEPPFDCIAWYEPFTASFAYAWLHPLAGQGGPGAILLDGPRAYLVHDAGATLRDLGSGEQASVGWSTAELRLSPALAVLRDGSLLVAGGRVVTDDGSGTPTTDAELLIPGD